MLSPNSKALRRGRHSEPGRVYLITFVAATRRRHFVEWDTAALIARELANSSIWGDSQLLCWVLMPDHWHGLLQLGTRGLSSSVGKAKAHASRVWRGELGQEGELWMPGFHDHALRKEDDMRSVAHYIVANPIRAGLVSRASDYPFWDAVWLNA